MELTPGEHYAYSTQRDWMQDPDLARVTLLDTGPWIHRLDVRHGARAVGVQVGGTALVPHAICRCLPGERGGVLIQDAGGMCHVANPRYLVERWVMAASRMEFRHRDEKARAAEKGARFDRIRDLDAKVRHISGTDVRGDLITGRRGGREVTMPLSVLEALVAATTNRKEA